MKTPPPFTAAVWDDHTLAAWCEQLSLAAHHPELTQQLLSRQHDYLPRFAQQYQTLRALPRRLRRSLQRQWQQTLAGIALLMTLGSPAFAATINVGGGCSLVDAITAANSDTATDGCSAGSGADTLVLPASSTQTLTTVNNTTFGATGLPLITSAITIQGNGSTISRVAGAPNFRIMAVNNSGNITIQDTTISRGVIDGTLGGADDGGGIANYEGNVTLSGSTVTGNSTTSDGGGVYNDGTMTLTNSTVSGNSANSVGGVRNDGTMTLTNSTVSGNSANSIGGVYNGGTMTLTNSTVSGNSAANVIGGVLNRRTMTLTNSTVSGNSANFFGGVYNNGPMTLTNSTVSGNSANGYGGVTNADTMTLSRSLISGNTGGSSPEVFNFSGTITADDFNLFGANGSSGTNFTPGATDIVPTAGVLVANILAPLALNAPGTTQTHALIAGSPAIDAAGATCSATDQRGIPRPQGAACDIGAFELLPATTCPATPTIFGTSNSEVILGTNGPDVIFGAGGNDTIDGLDGNDVLCGSDGNDTLNGGEGNDRLFGKQGNDTLNGDTGDDLLFGQSGDDTLNGGVGRDTLRGGPGADILMGGNQFDRLFGEAGNDRLFGQNDPDRLDGGLGRDSCDGGTGAGIDAAVMCETTSNVP